MCGKLHQAAAVLCAGAKGHLFSHFNAGLLARMHPLVLAPAPVSSLAPSPAAPLDAVPDWLRVSEAESVAVQLDDGEEVPLAVPELLRVSVCVADCVGDAEADAVTDWLGLAE